MRFWVATVGSFKTKEALKALLVCAATAPLGHRRRAGHAQSVLAVTEDAAVFKIVVHVEGQGHVSKLWSFYGDVGMDEMELRRPKPTLGIVGLEPENLGRHHVDGGRGSSRRWNGRGDGSERVYELRDELAEQLVGLCHGDGREKTPRASKNEQVTKQLGVAGNEGPRLSGRKAGAGEEAGGAVAGVVDGAGGDEIGVVAFIKSSKGGRICTSFLRGESKVAPRQAKSIPRPELCASLRALQLLTESLSDLHYDFKNIYLYSDSLVVLGYLRNWGQRFSKYVT
ncbi:hypothetical protein TCAL_17102 [Tigriopus californicus]|uniref:Uncharacterized protein n=1 Tax=Tigriopus californicus TaxID=6832 RepID=A0A553P4E8_TIGCA|nr:hypothetical protein TCAL_17102 [Tigriopus californicus]